MKTSNMGHHNRYERTVSSGLVFCGNTDVKGNSKSSFPLNKILLSLIEEEMELSYRSQNCLNNAGIKLMGQLVQKSESELLALKNFGRKSLKEIHEALTAMGLTLEMKLDFPPWNQDSNTDE